MSREPCARLVPLTVALVGLSLLVGCAQPQVDDLDPAPTSVSVTPAIADVGLGQSLAFSAWGVAGSGDPMLLGESRVTWSATGGTVSGAGLFQAGSTPGVFSVTATDGPTGLAGTAAVNVLTGPPAPLAAIELTPSNADMETGAPQQFSVVGRRSDGSTQGVTPSYSATGGTIAGSGLYTAGSGAGTFRVIATANGFADTSSITLTAPLPPETFEPADLVDLTFNNPADDNLILNSGGTMGVHQSWDATGGRNGSRAFRVQVSPQNDNGWGPVGPVWPNRGRVFVRWYFRMQGTPSGNVKGFRFHSDFATNQGGLYGGHPCWHWDWEPGPDLGACVDAGLEYGAAAANNTCSNLSNGAWHSLEVDYDRNAGSNVEVRLWCDGRAVVMPAGAATMYGTPVSATWSGGSRATNTPSTLRTSRQDRAYTSGVLIWPTISQAGGTATVWVDDVAASSQRIGP